MRYYRYPQTGEIVRFELETMEWRDMRCDQSTGYEVRFVPTSVPAHEAAELVPVTESEMTKDHAEMRKANSAARGELFLSNSFPNTHDKGGQWPGPFPV